MKFIFEPGAVRWAKWHGLCDVRLHRGPAGWDVTAELRDTHPITGKALKESQWWIREEYQGQ